MASSALVPAARRVLLIGGGITAVFMLLTALDLAGMTQAWENAYSVAAVLTAMGAAAAGYRSANPADRRLRRAITLSLGLLPASIIVYVLLIALGGWSSPSPLDLMFLSVAVPALLVLRDAVRTRRPGTRTSIVIVDYGLVLLGSTIGVGYAFADRLAGGLVSLIPLAYPVYFAALGGLALVGAAANNSELRLRGPYAIALGSVGIAAGLLWIDPATLSSPPIGHPASYLGGVAALVVGFGAATLSGVRETRPRQRAFAERLPAILPILSVVTATIVLVTSTGPATLEMDASFHLLGGAVFLLATVRQALTIDDAVSSRRALALAQKLTEAALAERAAAEVAARARADRLSAVVAASDELGSVDSGTSRFEAAVARILPPDGTGWLWRIDHASRGLELVAAHGPGSGAGEPHGRSILRAGWADERTPAAAEIVTWQGGPDEIDETDGSDASAPANLACPLVRDDAFVGMLQLHAPGGFAPEAVDFARLVANEIAIALENERLLGELRDRIDEMARVQARLIQTARLTATGELATAIAHEVNNPLTGVLGYSELLLAQLAPGHPMREDLAVIRSEAMRASDRIRALLDFSRPRQPNHVPTDLAELVDRTIGLVRYDLERHGITITERHESMPPVDLDSGAIEQVVMHILANARNAMPDGGTLAVETRAEAGEAVVAIRDSGVGMDEATRAHAFDPFFTTRDPSVGGGLGLSVSLRLVTEHGGSMALESSPNQGTLVVVRLPLVASRVGDSRVAA